MSKKDRRVSSQPTYYSILLYYYYIGSSPNRSSISCIFTSNTVFALLVDLFLPSFMYSFDIIIWFILYFVFFACITQLHILTFSSKMKLPTLLIKLGVQCKYYTWTYIPVSIVAFSPSREPPSLYHCQPDAFFFFRKHHNWLIHATHTHQQHQDQYQASPWAKVTLWAAWRVLMSGDRVQH